MELLKIFTAIMSHVQSNVELLCFNVADLQVPPVMNQERKSDDTLCCGLGMYAFKCHIKNFSLLIFFCKSSSVPHRPGETAMQKNSSQILVWTPRPSCSEVTVLTPLRCPT